MCDRRGSQFGLTEFIGALTSVGAWKGYFEKSFWKKEGFDADNPSG